METKIVYVLVSTEKDIYLEQAYVSMFSVKYYMPQSNIVLITDNQTYNSIQQNVCRKLFSQYVDEFIPVDLSSEYNNVERSRWLKTNIRALVKGKFLFLDTDTIVCSSLSEVDEWDFHIGAVLDLHIPFGYHPLRDKKKTLIKKMYGVDVPNDVNYYNSGVLFVNDTQEAYNFFDKWHCNWENGRHVENGYRDQQSLMKTEYDFNNFITPISGDYNCQVSVSIQFLFTAKIMHFFNAKITNETLSPFLNSGFYFKIKNNQQLNDEDTKAIVNCKSSFVSPSMIIGNNELIMRTSHLFRFFMAIYKKKRLFSFFNSILKLFF